MYDNGYTECKVRRKGGFSALSMWVPEFCLQDCKKIILIGTDWPNTRFSTFARTFPNGGLKANLMINIEQECVESLEDSTGCVPTVVCAQPKPK